VGWRLCQQAGRDGAGRGFQLTEHQTDRIYLPTRLTVVCRIMGNVSDNERLLNGRAFILSAPWLPHCAPAAAAFRAARCSHNRPCVFRIVLLISLDSASRLKVVMNVHCVFCEVRLWKFHLGHGSCNVTTCTLRTRIY